jgi:3-oxoacyl-[acyl-carrier-protein] synthase-1
MIQLAVIASGMVSALGFNSAASLAAMRSGISAVRELPWMDFESGEPLRGAKVSLPHWWDGVGKLADLLAPALAECLEAAAKQGDLRIPLLIGIAARDRTARPEGLEDYLLAAVEARLGRPHHPESALFPADQVGAAQALLHAQGLIDSGSARHVVVAGVDSFLSAGMLSAYGERRRLVTPANSNGFFPGEAGAAVLVAAAGNSLARSELRIQGMGRGQEGATIEGTEPFRAEGLTEAVKAALDGAKVRLKDVAWRLTDLSGEHYKFKEAAFVAGRLNGGERSVPLDLWHPIEYLGEIGAAILPCLLAQAKHAGEEDYAPGRLALCHVSSDAGERAAMVLALPERGRLP